MRDPGGATTDYDAEGQRARIVESAERTGARRQVPSGAIMGLDALLAAAEGHIKSVRPASP